MLQDKILDTKFDYPLSLHSVLWNCYDVVWVIGFYHEGTRNCEQDTCIFAERTHYLPALQRYSGKQLDCEEPIWYSLRLARRNIR